MTPFLFGLGAGVGFYLAGILYVMVAHWRPTPWYGPSLDQKWLGTGASWDWRCRLITKRWPQDGFPRWTL